MKHFVNLFNLITKLFHCHFFRVKLLSLFRHQRFYTASQLIFSLSNRKWQKTDSQEISGGQKRSFLRRRSVSAPGVSCWYSLILSVVGFLLWHKLDAKWNWFEGYSLIDYFAKSFFGTHFRYVFSINSGQYYHFLWMEIILWSTLLGGMI